MQGKGTVSEELMKYIPRKKFDEIVKKHDGDKWCKNFFCWDLFAMLLHGQLSGEMSMRAVELTNACQASYMKNIGAKTVSLSTLSDACKVRNPDVFMDVFWHVLSQLKTSTKLDKNMRDFVHLIDSTPIPLKGYGYEWAKDNYRTKGLKVHTVYDYELQSPIYFSLTASNVNDITEAKSMPIKAKSMPIKAKSIYVFDKGYYDFRWWNKINNKKSRFVTRIKKDTPFKIIERKKITGEHLHDWIIELTSAAGKRFNGLLRHIRIKLSNKKTIVIVSNDLNSDAELIAKLYKWRWEIELFFKCLKQNLKVKRFWGKSENAVRLQIITAMIAYVLLRITQIENQIYISIKQIHTIVRIKLHETMRIDSIFKIPDRHYTRKMGVNL